MKFLSVPQVMELQDVVMSLSLPSSVEKIILVWCYEINRFSWQSFSYKTPSACDASSGTPYK